MTPLPCRLRIAAVERVRDLNAARILARAFRDPCPVIVYSQPKTGTTSLEVALAAAGITAPKVHFLRETHAANLRRHADLGLPNPFHHFLEARLTPRLAGGARPRVVCLVREPVARRVSALFQAPWLFGTETAETEATVAALAAALRESAVRRDALSWFRRELELTFGIDLASAGFDPAAGFRRYPAERADVLVLRTEMLDRLGAVLSDFVGHPLALTRRNVRGETPEVDRYCAVRARLRLPRDVLQAIYADPLMGVFYTEAEIAALVDRWADGA